MSEKSWYIEKKLGEGGLGEVYLVRDPSGQRVALKILKLKTNQEIESFKREAKLLIRLRHPAVAAILGYEVDSAKIFGDDRGPCFWMEFVDGQDILSVARFARPEQVFTWLRQAVEALHEFHSQSILHNDLSPQNVLITRDGTVKLLDFGLATSVGENLMLRAGTVPYLAPERLSGQATPASDLFALGTIFYEALAQKHPRAKAKSMQELIRLEAPPLEEGAPLLANDYSLESRILDRMIRIKVDERFASSRDVLEALKNKPSGSSSVQAEFHSAQFIGAGDIFRKFEDAKALVSADSAMYWIHGISGVGKSRFLRELAMQLAIQGFQVNSFDASELSLGIKRLRQLDNPGYQAFIFKDLHHLEPEHLAPVFTLRRVGLTHPGALVFFEWNEDWLSDESRRFFDEMRKHRESEDIHLKNLSPRDTRDLLSSALGESVAEEIHEILHRQTAGNPRMLLQLIAILREKGIADKKYFARGDLDALSELQNFESIARFRFLRLSVAEKDLLAWIASAEGEISLEWLNAATALVAPRLAALLQRGLVVGEDFYSLAFPGLVGAIRQEEPEIRWRERQEKWFDCIPEGESTQWIKCRLAIQLGRAEYLEVNARKTAEQLENAEKYQQAVEILEGSIAILQNREEQSRLLRNLSNLLQKMNRFEQALAAAEKSFLLQANDEDPLLKRTKYYFVTGLWHQHLAHFDEAIRRLKLCLELEFNAGTMPFRVRALTLLAMEAKREDRLPEARQLLSQALELTGQKGRRRAEILRNLAIVFGREGDWPAARQHFQEAGNLYREENYIVGEISTYLEEGNQALNNDQVAEAEASYRQAERISQENEIELQMAIAWNNLGILHRKVGDLDRSLDYLGKAEAIFRALGHANNLGEHLIQHAMAKAAAGQFEAAKNQLDEIQGLSRQAAYLLPAKDTALAFLKEIQTGELAQNLSLKTAPKNWPNFWNRELALRALLREQPESDSIKEILEVIFRRLSVKRQVSFAERFDYQKYVLLKKTKIIKNADTSAIPQPHKETSMNVIEHLSAISRDLIRENNMDRVLLRLMDAAIEISGAENGFLLLKSELSEGPIPGFSVVVARNIKKEMIERLDFALSLSAIRQAMETGEPVVTDNALTDPRFSQAKSVQLHELKSILALPVLGAEGLLGVFYLDHRFEMAIFAEEKLAALRAFADQAALAMQKGQMIEDLKKSNSNLSTQVEEQSEQLSAMEKELKQSRLKLKHEYSEIIGRSPKMIQVLTLVDKITTSKIPVWIYGESGTGKESIARALHFNSARTKLPFVSENCSALPETLLESELFGHKRGAFTHADRDKKGILQYADKGTIFLDEIGDMSLNLQAKLLRFLQEGEIRPLGSNDVIKVDVRVVSASNKNLPQMVEAGKFREDLFFRLNGITVTLPSLRERKEDIPLLVAHFLKKVASREATKPCRIHPDALRVLMDYSWPGNIRELQNTIETAVLFAENGVVNTKSMQFKPQVFSKYKPVKFAGGSGDERDSLDPELANILSAIRDQGYHKGNAARALGISRRNLYVKLEKHKIPIDLAELKKFIDKRLVS